MEASAGGPSVPSPVQLQINDVDVSLMWRAAQIRRHGVGNPAMFIIGLLGLTLGLLQAFLPRHDENWWSIASPLLVGISFLLISLSKSGRSTGTLRPTELHFSGAGLDVDVAFAPPARRHYAWKDIRVDDVTDSFVIVPKFFKQRIVLPKRSFPDRGAEAWAFFKAHGVAGRTLPSPAAAPSLIG